MITLHYYILRELLKTFGLALLALTAIMTLSGGLFNMVVVAGVSGASLPRFLPYLVPIAVTLSMPVAALFAAAMVYGRLAADNELTACRAAGINIHRLFFSAMLLATLVSLFTLLSANFLLPDLARRADRILRTNFRDIFYQQLRARGYWSLRDQHFVTAAAVQDVSPDELVRQQLPVGPGYSYILVRKPTLLQVNKAGQAVRFSAADWGLFQFDSTQENLRVSVWAGRGRDFEVGKRATEIAGQKLLTYDPEIRIPEKPHLQNLATLLIWRTQPWLADKVAAEWRRFRTELAAWRFYLDAVKELNDGRKLTLTTDGDQAVTLSAARCEAGSGGEPLLTDVRATVGRPGERLPTRYEAPRGELVLRPAEERFGTTAPSAPIELRLVRSGEQRVREFAPVGDKYASPRESSNQTLSDLRLPPQVEQQVAEYTPERVLDPDEPLELNESLRERREGLQKRAGLFSRQINALIHFRLGFASSALVTVLMGAALGVIFQGARALAAFGLACIPLAIVTVFMLLGRTLAEGRQTVLIGLIVMWGGLALVAVADVVILRLGVRR